MRKFAALTGLYSMSHFIVDFSCAFIIFSKVSGSEQWLMCLLIYNFFAFAMQMPLGLVADKIGRDRFFAASGCMLAAFAPLFAAAPFLLCAAAGLGNALFHIGAGREILCGSRKRFAALGIFVSPGALGIYLGAMLGKSGALPMLAVLSALAVCAGVILLAVPSLNESKENRCITGEKPNFRSAYAFMLLCLFLVVCLRSYVGITLSFPWKGEWHYALLLVLSVVLGKALGGIVADRFGAIWVSFASLFICAALFLFYKLPACGILAVFLFNMTMPITLGAVRNLLPQSPGFGFGILTFGLFLGIIPVLTDMKSFLVLPYGYTAVCIVSACLLYYGLKERRNAAKIF